MCGIFGFFLYSSPSDSESILKKMAASILHRGPDNTGIHYESGLGIGNNRLAIVDLASGNQPMFNEDRSMCIVYNGEIYNHQDIRKDLESKGHRYVSRSDTETVLHAFEEYGEHCLMKFNGMFAFAIWNARTRRLFVARDRLGIKPFYYATLAKSFVFGSEAKAVLSALESSPAPDWEAIHRYFCFGYVPSPQSPFKGVKKLPAGHYAWIDNNGIAIQSWWEPSYGLGEPVSFREAQDKVVELMQRAVELEMMSDVPVGIFLSGGLDSSTVALFANKRGQGKLQSYSIRFEESTHDESADARAVAEHLNLDHHEVTFTRSMVKEYLFKVAKTLDEPFGDSTVLPLLAVSEFARQNVKVVLTGWGGDEIFAGYPTYKAHLMARCFRGIIPISLVRGCLSSLANWLPVSDRYMSFEFKAKRFLKGMNLTPEIQHFVWMSYMDDMQIRCLLKPAILEEAGEDALYPVKRATTKLRADELISRIMHLDTSFFLEGNGLFQADRMTMAASLEARVPLLNNDLVEYVNALPARVKMPFGRPKELIRKAVNGLLPKQIVRKPKKGFGPPSAAWTREALSETLDQTFTRASVEENGIFVYDEIRRMLHEHRSRRADHGRSIWALLSFQLWYNNFIEKPTTAN